MPAKQKRCTWAGGELKLYVLGAVLCLLGMNFYWYSTTISFTSDKPLGLTGLKVDVMFGGVKKSEIQGSIPYSFFDIKFPLAEEVEENKHEEKDERIYGRVRIKHAEENFFNNLRAASFYFVAAGVLVALFADSRKWKFAGGSLTLLPAAVLAAGIALLPLLASAPEGIKMVTNTKILGGWYLTLAGGLLICSEVIKWQSLVYLLRQSRRARKMLRRV